VLPGKDALPASFGYLSSPSAAFRAKKKASYALVSCDLEISVAETSPELSAREFSP